MTEYEKQQVEMQINHLKYLIYSQWLNILGGRQLSPKEKQEIFFIVEEFEND